MPLISPPSFPPPPHPAPPPQGVGLVVFDEVHYLGDPGRGSVWEEAIIALPREVQMFAMSATVRNPDDLGGWITQVGGRRRQPSGRIRQHSRQSHPNQPTNPHHPQPHIHPPTCTHPPTLTHQHPSIQPSNQLTNTLTHPTTLTLTQPPPLRRCTVRATPCAPPSGRCL
jgi:hypothetical protein